ncbi:mevalonate kinase [Candidatus Woesearchaeota archaeon]|nr:mevalonate kinase [Candidatus Woesearchaeota archaeon]|tara:strand:+ start:4840 stop:5724 length:885 start_codon:yes stop_codon:yes gene_type:complete
MVSLSACGKIILFGEHSVVYGKPAIAVPLKDLRIEARVESCDELTIDDDTPDPDEERPKKFVKLILDELEAGSNIKIAFNTNMPVSSGFGASAAFCVASVKAIAGFNNMDLPVERIKEISSKAEALFHGNASGLDTAVVAHEKPIYFVKGKEPELLNIYHRFSFAIVNTGIKSNTSEVVAELRERYEADKQRIGDVFDEVEEIVRKGRVALEKGDVSLLGELMDKNQDCLERLGVSCSEIDNVIRKLKGFGALGAKLSGAGKGGNVIALFPEEIAEEVKEALEKEGKDVIIAKL